VCWVNTFDLAGENGRLVVKTPYPTLSTVNDVSF